VRLDTHAVDEARTCCNIHDELELATVTSGLLMHSDDFRMQHSFHARTDHAGNARLNHISSAAAHFKGIFVNLHCTQFSLFTTAERYSAFSAGNNASVDKINI